MGGDALIAAMSGWVCEPSSGAKRAVSSPASSLAAADAFHASGSYPHGPAGRAED